MTQSASPLTLMPGKVGIGTLRKIYRDGISVELDPSCQAKVQAASDIVMAAANGKDPVYGVNTGFGKLAQKRIAPADTKRLQRNLILSHASGVGEPLAEPIVRLIMSLKLISLGRGASGVRWELITLLQDMLRARGPGADQRDTGFNRIGAGWSFRRASLLPCSAGLWSLVHRCCNGVQRAVSSRDS